MEQPVLVTAAIIERRGKYLITQRPKESHNGLRWEFPGGKVNFGEDPRTCLERELEEELGIKIKAGDVFGYSSYVYNNNKHIILLAFLCKCLGGEISKRGINDYAWANPLEMKKYDITEADLPFVAKLK